MADFTVCEISVPSADDVPPSWVVEQSVELSRRVELETTGSEDTILPAPGRIARYRRQEDAFTVSFVAVTGVDTAGLPTGRVGLPALSWDAREAGLEGAVLGIASVHVGLTSNTHLAEVGAQVLPDARRQGVGRALLAECERVATERGCRTVTGWADHRAVVPGEETVTPSGGVGAVPLDDPGTRFALALGYGLEQAEAQSVLELPLDTARLAPALAEAEERSAGYTTRTVHDRIPDELAASYVAMMVAFTESSPKGGLDLEETPWDEARLRREEEMFAAMGGRTVTTLALDATGEVVAQTTIGVRNPGTGYQAETVVVPGHRGHRLGLLVKARNTDALVERFPDVRRVLTWNAEENDHMLAINEALGYVPRTVGGAWQREL